MYKQPSWYKNKTLDLAKITDQQLATYREEMDRVFKENTRIHDQQRRSIHNLMAEAEKIYPGDHPVIKAIRKSLRDVEPSPSYIKDFIRLKRDVLEAREREARNAKQREYYRQHKQLLIDLKDAAILECGDEAGPYQPEALGL